MKEVRRRETEARSKERIIIVSPTFAEMLVEKGICETKEEAKFRLHNVMDRFIKSLRNPHKSKLKDEPKGVHINSRGDLKNDLNLEEKI